MTVRATEIDDIRESLRAGGRYLPLGAGTKTALSRPDAEIESLDVSALRGVLEYLPSEFTVTARAGTPIEEIGALLEEEGQYLPFDPLLVAAGATLGGTVASGLAGSGRARYGGIRDFILGVELVDGEGRLVRGGGKVVKNAAGFDLPKLMVGSLGSFGVLTEVTLKVFPRARHTLSLRKELGSVEEGVECLRLLLHSPFEVDALDLSAPDASLFVRLCGAKEGLEPRMGRLRELVGGGDVLDPAAESAHWRKMRELEWLAPDQTLVKVPLTPSKIAPLEVALGDQSPARFYTGAGQQLWLVLEPGGEPEALDEILLTSGLSGLVVIGPGSARRLGVGSDREVLRRILEAFDPLVRLRDPLSRGLATAG